MGATAWQNKMRRRMDPDGLLARANARRSMSDFQLAARLGHPVAALQLSFQSSRSGDEAATVKWLRRAAQSGLVEAQEQYYLASRSMEAAIWDMHATWQGSRNASMRLREFGIA